VPDDRDPFDRLRGMDDDDDPRPLRRPRPGHPVVGRLHDGVEPWVAWFGVRRMVGAAATVVVLVVGGWWLLRAPASPTEAGLPFASPPTSSVAVAPGSSVPGRAPPTTAAGPLVVHVAGAVVAPGLYELRASARTADALAAAGGAAPDADVDALNLAAPVRDGERVYVPVVGEDVPPPAAVPPGSAPAAGPVDLNRATVAELDALPGIGPATAAAIVAHREVSGPFASVEDLEQVRGIGPAKLATIRPLVTV
jgi:competence protein ComEA